MEFRLRDLDYGKQDVLWLTMRNRKFYPYDCGGEAFDIEEIANSLSKLCRFNGNTNKFYSVAEHSLNVMELILDEFPTNKKLAYEGLMHDATEAYLGDLVTPLKQVLPKFNKIEHEVAVNLFKKHKVTYPFNPIVHSKDWMMCLIEKSILMPHAPKWFDHEDTTVFLKAHKMLVKGLSPDKAKENFIHAYTALTKDM